MNDLHCRMNWDGAISCLASIMKIFLDSLRPKSKQNKQETSGLGRERTLASLVSLFNTGLSIEWRVKWNTWKSSKISNC